MGIGIYYVLFYNMSKLNRQWFYSCFYIFFNDEFCFIGKIRYESIYIYIKSDMRLRQVVIFIMSLISFGKIEQKVISLCICFRIIFNMVDFVILFNNCKK